MRGREERAALRPRLWDLALLAGILLLAGGLILILHFCAEDGVEAVVTVDGEEVARLSLDRDHEITIPTEAGVHRIRVQDGQVSVVEAPCRDQICVHHAPASVAGETIVCLPCRLVVTVLAAGESPIPGEVSP